MRWIPSNTREYAYIDDKYAWLVDAAGWYVNKQGYLAACIKGKKQKLHRVIIALEGWPNWQRVRVDHENRNKLDCQVKNLRPATMAQNAMNRTKRQGTSSRFKGVCRVSREARWMAKIKKNGRAKHLGYFDCEIAAARAYDEAARSTFGTFAALNFPPEPASA